MTQNGTSKDAPLLRFAIPKGRMQNDVMKLLTDAGINVSISDRGYRPSINMPNVDVKLLKPQNIIEMLHAGSRDIGFGGADWVANLQVTNVVQLIDTKMDPVRVVAAGPHENMIEEAVKTQRHLSIASEYEHLTKDWIQRRGLNASFVRAYGATESFPPEDADMIVDNTATGSTLRANGLTILDTVFTSTTRLYANKDALLIPEKKAAIDKLVILLESVLAARSKVMITFNINTELHEAVISSLPCMRAPSVQQLHHSQGFAVSVCVDRQATQELLPKLKAQGATDIIVTKVDQIVA